MTKNFSAETEFCKIDSSWSRPGSRSTRRRWSRRWRSWRRPPKRSASWRAGCSSQVTSGLFTQSDGWGDVVRHETKNFVLCRTTFSCRIWQIFTITYLSDCLNRPLKGWELLFTGEMKPGTRCWRYNFKKMPFKIWNTAILQQNRPYYCFHVVLHFVAIKIDKN
jgi:hypothetical protein